MHAIMAVTSDNNAQPCCIVIPLHDFQAAGGLKTTPADMMKGLVPQMAGAMPAGALQFLAYEQTKTELNKLNKNVTLGGLRPHLTEICAAAVGAAAASIVRVPQERVKQPIQVLSTTRIVPPTPHHSRLPPPPLFPDDKPHCHSFASAFSLSNLLFGKS